MNLWNQLFLCGFIIFNTYKVSTVPADTQFLLSSCHQPAWYWLCKNGCFSFEQPAIWNCQGFTQKYKKTCGFQMKWVCKCLTSPALMTENRYMFQWTKKVHKYFYPLHSLLRKKVTQHITRMIIDYTRQGNAPHIPPVDSPHNGPVSWARFLSLAWSKLRLCSANHRPGYWSNLPCDWPSTAWAYSEQETENGPWALFIPRGRKSQQIKCVGGKPAT